MSIWLFSINPDTRRRCSLVVPMLTRSSMLTHSSIHSYSYILPSPLITTAFTEVTTRPLTLYPSIKIFLSFLLL